ncbi:ABC transporter ATP-binding protein [Xylanimonas ulmi]|uniref:Amino acid/amide ABC transporter ATP-binding protein 1 (HAAT family) n=1 Tax=Xylanimonas ulmi TaxID=228973 RepID=A0A4V2EY30_9MICO|nr:ABC transporter ATP-binding protein [Xylanibacterium ulmi]RZS61560.1 amino acid/amide ABC transporter ATP-binding protein 1 (HAAT family) [Xylanibacterium ulmi]
MTPSAPVLLDIRDLCVRFGGIAALDGPSLAVRQGEICGLIGPNGAGKTTLFNCVSRLHQPDSGSITLGGQDLLRLRADQIAGAGVARTFQSPGLFTSLTVVENVLVGAYHRTPGGLGAATLALPSVARHERRQRVRAMAVLDELGLADVADRVAAGLPFGTLKRVELARALMCDPRLLLLDEPANGLIHGEVMELAAVIATLCRERGLSVLLVEHHMAMVMAVSHHVVALNFGRKIADGAPEEVRAHPDVVAAYLGSAA